MTENQRRQMKASEISDFVDEVIAAGCGISAVGYKMYVIGDVEEQEEAKEELDRIGNKYGNRDPLKLEIVAHLWSIGRYIEVASESTRH